MSNQATLRLFQSSREHLLAELKWLELVVQREAARTGLLRVAEEKFDEFSGLYISEQEIARYISGQAVEERQLSAGSETLERLSRDIAAGRQQLDESIDGTLAAGFGLRIVDLRRAFHLTPADFFILLSAMAPDVDVRFQRYFAYLQNDVAKKRPTLQLLNRIWADGQTDRVSVRETFAPESPLVFEKLLLFPRAGEDQPFPAQHPLVAESVADFLAGVDSLDRRLRGFTSLIEPWAHKFESGYQSRHREISTRLLSLNEKGADPPLAYIWGPLGNGKGAIVETVVKALGRRVLRVCCGTWLTVADSARQNLDLLRREARLHGCTLHFSDVDALLGQEPPLVAGLTVFREFLEANRSAGIVITGARRFAEIRNALGIPLVGFEIPYPSIEEREEIWREKLDGLERSGNDEWVSRLAVSFCFTPGQIDAAVRNALRAQPQNSIANQDAPEELFRNCREESNQTLLNFATKIVPRYRWTDIVLPPDTQAQLDEICNCVRSRGIVFETWGFGGKFSLGRGLNVLFAGDSGTGKTMSAEIIAGDLQLDLFKIDLSCIVSKYVGETERNLSKIFHEAQTSNSILFFDEADALFGKRSEVKDAHDRYANIEINYLLQKMDDYEGIVILATNLRSNLDAAFTRRLNYVVEFPFPDESHRETIWRKVFPQLTPLCDDIDFEFLAKRFKLAGGNIKNIALNGAFLASRNGGRVTMEHLIHATRREFQKMGKLCSKSDFGCYYRLLRQEVVV
jgi:hypothetical protein